MDAKLYPVTAGMIKRFTRGSLEGLSVDDEVAFTSKEEALKWYEKCKDNPKLPYFITHFELFNTADLQEILV